MDPYYQHEHVTLYHGDCLDVLAELPDTSMDAVVTDPPYGLDFMGKHWDTGAVAFDVAVWGHCLRVLKPGGHLAAFGGTRTHHRLASAIEDSGFEIRDSLAWLYGSGFPKSLNVGDGRGTALKPAHEPICLARKPIVGTVAGNVEAHGTGALNIDTCRVAHDEPIREVKAQPNYKKFFRQGGRHSATTELKDSGRWPANVLLDQVAADELDRQSGVQKDGVAVNRNRDPENRNSWYGTMRPISYDAGFGGEGGASRYFPVFRYTAKAPASERPTYKSDGASADTYGTRKRCITCGKQEINSTPSSQCQCAEPEFAADPTQQGIVSHPTVKPLDLMRWLVRLITPPGGLVLDPFAGSGTTAEACIHEYRRCVTIERETEYLPLIVARLSKPMAIGFDFGEAS